MQINDVSKLLGAAFVAALATWPMEGASARVGERVRIGEFEIDATEVTIGQFQAFARKAGLKTEAEKAGGGFEWGAGWERRPGWMVYRPFGEEPRSPDEPAVHVTWGEARAYCEAQGGRLPSAAEWRRAAYTEMRESPAAGLETGRTYRYPVGDTPDGMNTSGDDSWSRHAPAGSTKSGVNGLFDMGGNVWEWLSDRRGDDALTAGGSWWYDDTKTLADRAQWKPVDFYAVYVGFRCVYGVE